MLPAEQTENGKHHPLPAITSQEDPEENFVSAPSQPAVVSDPIAELLDFGSNSSTSGPLGPTPPAPPRDNGSDLISF